MDALQREKRDLAEVVNLIGSSMCVSLIERIAMQKDPKAHISELEPLPLRGVPFWDETVLYDRPTKTLIAPTSSAPPMRRTTGAGASARA